MGAFVTPRCIWTCHWARRLADSARGHCLFPELDATRRVQRAAAHLAAVLTDLPPAGDGLAGCSA